MTRGIRRLLIAAVAAATLAGAGGLAVLASTEAGATGPTATVTGLTRNCATHPQVLAGTGTTTGVAAGTHPVVEVSYAANQHQLDTTQPTVAADGSFTFTATADQVVAHLDNSAMTLDWKVRDPSNYPTIWGSGQIAINACPTPSVSTPGGTVTVDTTNGGNVVGLTNSGVPSSPTPPAGVSFPYGLLGFQVVDMGSRDGLPMTITVTLPAPATSYWKFQNGTWTQVLGATFNGNQVTFTLTDGGFGDADGSLNGTIVDPGAPGVAAAATSAPADAPLTAKFTG